MADIDFPQSGVLGKYLVRLHNLCYCEPISHAYCGRVSYLVVFGLLELLAANPLAVNLNFALSDALPGDHAAQGLKSHQDSENPLRTCFLEMVRCLT